MGPVSEHMAYHRIRDSLTHSCCPYGAVILSLSSWPSMSSAEEPEQAGVDTPIGDVGEFAVRPRAATFDARFSGIPSLPKGCLFSHHGSGSGTGRMITGRWMISSQDMGLNARVSSMRKVSKKPRKMPRRSWRLKTWGSPLCVEPPTG